MQNTIEQIYRKFDGKLVGTRKMKHLVCETLTHMPTYIVAHITKDCWFMGTMEDAWAFAFTGNDLKDQHLIFLSDELLVQSDSQIRYTIAHEIGHIVLGHKNSVLLQQTKAEIRKQEKEADAFAKKYTHLTTK